MPQPTAKLTKKQQRERELEAAAKAATKDYKPLSGDVFNKSRDYVSAQFDIAFEVEERYRGIMDERSGIRDDLRGLERKRLLTPEEAVLLHTMFPVRERKDDNANGDGSAA